MSFMTAILNLFRSSPQGPPSPAEHYNQAVRETKRYRIKSTHLKTHPDIVQVKSYSNPEHLYLVDKANFVCSCPHWKNRLSRLPLTDPHRLCKHLVYAITQTGIPENFRQYEEEIFWFAHHHCGFTTRDHALAMEVIAHNMSKTPLSINEIETLSTVRKRKYCYLSGAVRSKHITAQVCIDTGCTQMQINSHWATYDPATKAASFPHAYEFMKSGICAWIDAEYAAIKTKKGEKYMKPAILISAIIGLTLILPTAGFCQQKGAHASPPATIASFSGTLIHEARFDNPQADPKELPPQIPKSWRFVGVSNGEKLNSNNLWFQDGAGNVYLIQGFTSNQEFTLREPIYRINAK